MELKEIVLKLGELVRKDVDEISAEINTLKTAFDKKLEQKKEEALKKFKAEGGDELMFEPPKFNEEGKYKELINLFNERKKKHFEEKKLKEQKNLKAKKEVIAELKELIDKEENIGKAFGKFNELREKWKSIGDVSVHKYKDLQNDYRQEIERFYYNINIYKELKSHDLKRNYDLKVLLIEKIRMLTEHDNITNIQEAMRAYQDEWDEIGPTTKENWEAVREQFHEATSLVYEKIKDHYTSIREQQNQNLEQKEALCRKAEELSEEIIDAHKLWEEKTAAIIELQKQYKTIGFAGKNKDRKMHSRFRKACDRFFGNKAAFYQSQKKEHKNHKEQKAELVEKVKFILPENIDDNVDWKKLTGLVINLQKKWKEVGSAGSAELPLWKDFRTACDDFFQKKKEYFDSLKGRQKDNLKEKAEITRKIKEYKLSGDVEKDKEALKQLTDDFNSVGFVPRDKIKKAMQEYNAALDAKYDELGMNKVQKTKTKYISKVDRLKDAQNADEILDKEKQHIKRNIKKLEADILQYENNLGFFGNSKGTNALKQQVEDKIEKAKRELNSWKEKYKVADKSLRDLKAEAK